MRFNISLLIIYDYFQIINLKQNNMKQIYLTLMLVAFAALQAMADSKLESGT